MPPRKRHRPPPIAERINTAASVLSEAMLTAIDDHLDAATDVLKADPIVLRTVTAKASIDVARKYIGALNGVPEFKRNSLVLLLAESSGLDPKHLHQGLNLIGRMELHAAITPKGKGNGKR